MTNPSNHVGRVLSHRPKSECPVVISVYAVFEGAEVCFDQSAEPQMPGDVPRNARGEVAGNELVSAGVCGSNTRNA